MNDHNSVVYFTHQFAFFKGCATFVLLRSPISEKCKCTACTGKHFSVNPNSSELRSLRTKCRRNSTSPRSFSPPAETYLEAPHPLPYGAQRRRFSHAHPPRVPSLFCPSTWAPPLNLPPSPPLISAQQSPPQAQTSTKNRLFSKSLASTQSKSGAKRFRYSSRFAQTRISTLRRTSLVRFCSF